MPIDRPNVSAHSRADGMPLHIAWRQLGEGLCAFGNG